MKKLRFIYLIQGDCSEPMYEIPSGSDFLYLQWQSEFKPQVNHFHLPKSSWAEGRNELLRRAKALGDYDYFVFLDDDLIFGWSKRFHALEELRAWQLKWPRLLQPVVRGRWALNHFENWIRRSNPIIGVPNTLWHQWYANVSSNAVDGITCFDHMFMAIHNSALENLFPYSVDYDQRNWWICGEMMCLKASSLYAGKIHRYNRLFVRNQQARAYPRDTSDWTHIKNELTTADRSPLSIYLNEQQTRN